MVNVKEFYLRLYLLALRTLLRSPLINMYLTFIIYTYMYS